MTDSANQPPWDSVLGRMTSGIYILTIGTGEQSTGMLASWVMQAGFDPPSISVAVKSGRYVEEWLTNGQPFVINVVAEKQFEFLKHFGSGFDLNEPAFDGIETTASSHGVPILSQSMGYLECEPSSHADSGDHRVFVAKIIGGGLHADLPPMIHVRKSGSHY